ncbi:MAG TPA: hypothetical protein VHZ33_27650 [Trebonia sp.]|jgi:hypothetical protein|nr:hypothetical protein [Trebonia sp.]
MQPVVHEDAAAASRLSELALTAADLTSALIGADREARRWTPLAPQMMAGLARWGKTNELLRARLVERGWCHDSAKGLPRTINPSGNFAIVATTGDSMTGHRDFNPATKYAKGVQTMRAVGRNVQLAFDFPDLYTGEALWALADDGDGLATWLLLYHVTRDQIRAELSLAHGIDRRGHVSEWMERIILPAVLTARSDRLSRGGQAG